ATTARAAPRAMTSTWSNASIAGCAKRLVRSTPSSKGRISNSPRKPAKNSITTKSACSLMAIAGNANSPRASRSTRLTAETGYDAIARDFLLSLCRRNGRLRGDGDRLAQPGAFGVVPHSRLRQCGRIVHSHGRRVFGLDLDHRLCRG